MPWSLAEKEATVDVLTNDLKEIRTLENIKQSELAEGLKTRQADNASNYYIGIASGEVTFGDLRLAASHLTRITEKIDADSILGEIFSNFCIGK